MTANTTQCSDCAAEILARTAAKTGGKCMPCATGIRADIEESKQRRVEEREKDRKNASALERISRTSSPAFEQFLGESDPLGVLWPFLVSVVYHDGKTEDVDALTPQARNIYFVQILDAEIVNGGLHQYFSNSSGRYAHETLAALLELGAAHSAKLLQQAIHCFPRKQVSKDREVRDEQLDGIDAGRLDALDTKYYALADGGTEDLAELVLAFMKKHRRAHIAA
jgi:hypothetical protein